MQFIQVKNWFTFNEPNFYCMFGYNGLFPPRVNQSGIASYICGHNALIAHAKTYRMYNEQFQNKQRGLKGYSSIRYSIFFSFSNILYLFHRIIFN